MSESEMKTADIVGKTILSQDGREVGEVQSLYVDVQTWRATAMGIKVNKHVLEALNLKRRFLGSASMKVAIEQVSGVTDTVVLKSTLTELAFVGGRHGDEEARREEPVPAEAGDEPDVTRGEEEEA